MVLSLGCTFSSPTLLPKVGLLTLFRLTVCTMILFAAMPQLNPFWWVNLMSWTFAILAFTTWYHHRVSFPSTLRIQLTRAFISITYV